MNADRGQNGIVSSYIILNYFGRIQVNDDDDDVFVRTFSK